MPRKLFVVAYDVRAPKRLSKALKIVRGFASGGQKSAYECWLSAADRSELKALLSHALNLDDDSVALIPLSPRARVSALGIAEAPEDPSYFYIG